MHPMGHFRVIFFHKYWDLSYRHMLIPVWLQTPYGYGESPNAIFFVSLPLSIRGLPYGNGETKWLIILIC
jgi:hypothetical protein